MPRSRSSETSARRGDNLGPKAIAVVLIVLVAAGFLVWNQFLDDGSESDGERDDTVRKLVSRACTLDKDVLLRMWRGFDPVATDRIMMVPREPNFIGTFDRVSHTGPWDYIQTVPLVFYGPQRIEARGVLDEHATLTDVYPTVEELVGVDLPRRGGGKVLNDALVKDQEGVPRLVFVVMWDGVGRNVLERWPKRWPTLARLESEGTSYIDATVGSSPSITPATHSNLGTGAWPRQHGVIAIDVGTEEGEVVRPFEDGDPSALKLSTFADEIDPVFDNESEVGMVGWQIQLPGETAESNQSWHQGMLGHGAAWPGGDKDHLALLGHGGEMAGNEEFFEVPEYAVDSQLLETEAQKTDLTDGKEDGKWFYHKLLETHNNPAWIRYQKEIVLRILQNEGYGQDETTDFFLTNFKITDIVGHAYTLDSPRMGDALEAQDEALGEIIDYLDAAVGDYVLVLSADHGHTPRWRRSGGWPISPPEMKADLAREFGVPETTKLIESASASGLFPDEAITKEFGITIDEMAEFLNDYSIGENSAAGEPLRRAFKGREDENVLSAALPRKHFDEVMECAFGKERPPADLDD